MLCEIGLSVTYEPCVPSNLRTDVDALPTLAPPSRIPNPNPESRIYFLASSLDTVRRSHPPSTKFFFIPWVHARRASPLHFTSYQANIDRSDSSSRTGSDASPSMCYTRSVAPILSLSFQNHKLLYRKSKSFRSRHAHVCESECLSRGSNVRLDGRSSGGRRGSRMK